MARQMAVRINPALKGSDFAVEMDDEVFVGPELFEKLMAAAKSSQADGVRAVMQDVKYVRIQGGCYLEPDFRCQRRY